MLGLWLGMVLKCERVQDFGSVKADNQELCQPSLTFATAVSLSAGASSAASMAACCAAAAARTLSLMGLAVCVE
jgi:hypothetical protein